MTSTPGSLAPPPGDIQLIARDLAAASGALSEIATTWRRAQTFRPDLPLELPQGLADKAQQLAADIQLLAATGYGNDTGIPTALAQEVSALREGIAAARAMTRSPGDPGVGDAGLWEYIGPAPSFVPPAEPAGSSAACLPPGEISGWGKGIAGRPGYTRLALGVR